jgi:hypothetical protein
MTQQSEIVDRVNKAIDAVASGRILAPRIQELVNAADDLRAAYEVMARSDGPQKLGADDDAEWLMREFYLSPSYDPKAARPADNVKAAIQFTIDRLTLQHKGTAP